jgi:hypothetical protein
VAQDAHSRSVKTEIVTGASASPNRAPSWGMPAISRCTSSSPSGTSLLGPPSPTAIEMIAASNAKLPSASRTRGTHFERVTRSYSSTVATAL